MKIPRLKNVKINRLRLGLQLRNCTEVRFASFLSGGFITAILVNPPERKLAKRTSVHWFEKYIVEVTAIF